MDQTPSLPMRRSRKPGLTGFPTPAPHELLLTPQSLAHVTRLPPSSGGFLPLLHAPITARTTWSVVTSVPTAPSKNKDDLSPTGDPTPRAEPGLGVTAARSTPSTTGLLFNLGQPCASPSFTVPSCKSREGTECFYGAFQLRTFLTFYLADGDADRGQERMWKAL